MSYKPRFSVKDSQVVISYYRVLNRVYGFFKDTDKSHQWLNTKNSLLSGFAPIQMIELGMSKRLENWISDQLEENNEPVKQIGFK